MQPYAHDIVGFLSAISPIFENNDLKYVAK